MDDEFVTLTNNLGLKPQGKSAPMKSSTTSFHHNNNNSSSPSISDFDYDTIFNNNNNNSSPAKTSDKTPVYEKPLYDDDIFDVAKSKPASDEFDDLFGNLGGNGGDFDELLPGFGSAAPSSRYCVLFIKLLLLF